MDNSAWNLNDPDTHNKWLELQKENLAKIVDEAIFSAVRKETAQLKTKINQLKAEKVELTKQLKRWEDWEDSKRQSRSWVRVVEWQLKNKAKIS